MLGLSIFSNYFGACIYLQYSDKPDLTAFRLLVINSLQIFTPSQMYSLKF